MYIYIRTGPCRCCFASLTLRQTKAKLLWFAAPAGLGDRKARRPPLMDGGISATRNRKFRREGGDRCGGGVGGTRRREPATQAACSRQELGLSTSAGITTKHHRWAVHARLDQRPRGESRGRHRRPGGDPRPQRPPAAPRRAAPRRGALRRELLGGPPGGVGEAGGNGSWLRFGWNEQSLGAPPPVAASDLLYCIFARQRFF